MNEPLHQIELPGIPKVASGKVREIFDLGEHLLLVTTDRISAFDCILPTAIPGKGAVLTQLSAFWCGRFPWLRNHLVTAEVAEFPAILAPYAETLCSRAMVVHKAKPLPVECVVRGYLAGSGWKDYRATGGIGGHTLPPGLREAERLPETLFTPSTKAEKGHDETITWPQCCALIGEEAARRVRDYSIRLYEEGREYAASRGIIVADTKFEFGWLDGEIVLIDECLTPDSSRFWAAAEYSPGMSPPSFDKQFVRDYLETLEWDKRPPAPALPEAVVERTAAKYREAQDRLTRAM